MPRITRDKFMKSLAGRGMNEQKKEQAWQAQRQRKQKKQPPVGKQPGDAKKPERSLSKRTNSKYESEMSPKGQKLHRKLTDGFHEEINNLHRGDIHEDGFQMSGGDYYNEMERKLGKKVADEMVINNYEKANSKVKEVFKRVFPDAIKKYTGEGEPERSFSASPNLTKAFNALQKVISQANKTDRTEHFSERRNLVPIKIGHTSMLGGEQPIRGEIDDVRVTGNVLYADLVDILEEDITHLKRHPSPSVEVKPEAAQLQGVAFLGGTPAFHPMPAITHFEFSKQPDGTFRVDNYPIFCVPFERDGFEYSLPWLNDVVKNFRSRRLESSYFSDKGTTLNFSFNKETIMPTDDITTAPPTGDVDPNMAMMDLLKSIVVTLGEIKTSLETKTADELGDEEIIPDEEEETFAEDEDEDTEKPTEDDKKKKSDAKFMARLRRKEADDIFRESLDKLWAEGKLFATPEAVFSSVPANHHARKLFVSQNSKNDPEKVKLSMGVEFMDYAKTKPTAKTPDKTGEVPKKDIAEFRDDEYTAGLDVKSDGSKMTDEEVAAHLLEIRPDKYGKK